MKKLLTGMAAVAVAVAMLSSSPDPAQAAYARGYDRPVDVKVLNFWLSHTYAYYSGYGYKSFGGTASGGHSHYYTTSIYSNEYTCMSKAASLTYAVTGVCHQGTNRGLYRTSIPYVKYWGDVGGAGTSYSLFCHMGAALWCYGPPC